MKKAISRKNILQSAPAFLKQTVGRLLEPVPVQWLLGRTFREHRERLRSAQWWKAEEARKHQLAGLRAILALAYERTIFYRRQFDAVGFQPGGLQSPEQIRSLPTVDRNAITENLADMCTKSVSARDVDQISTGGTSGSPLYFYANASRSAVEYAYLTSSWARAGYKLGMPMAVLRGRVVRADRDGLYHEYDPLLRHHHYSSFHMSDENMGRYVEHMATIGPCFLHVYPSTVAALARFLRRMGRQAPANVRGIIAESEIVYPEQRRMVEEVFGAACTILEPASWCWPSPANAMDSVSPLACSPIR